MPELDYKKRSYFHCYATANDKWLYLKDIKNLLRLRDCKSGVDKVQLHIAISEVRKVGAWDRFFIRTVKKLFQSHSGIELKSIGFKPNLGRDFSSYSHLRDQVLKVGEAHDFAFFQNRSSIGPYKDGWYKNFIQQFLKFKQIALCGSTINFRDHPKRSTDKLPHVQTYNFLTTSEHLQLLPKIFPGADQHERLQVILQGEIGLSQFYLQKGYAITCMEWPDLLVNNDTILDERIDEKEKVQASHDFYHRQYLRRNKNMKMKTSKAWKIYIRSALNKSLSQT